MFLQQHLNQVLGPLLVVVGLLLLDVIPWPWVGSGSSIIEKIQAKARTMGLWGAGVLGLVFALTFCPVSAALFFGSLIPLALSANSKIALPALYGIGTGLPVALLAIGLAVGAQSVSTAVKRLGEIERWVRPATGVVFVAAGIYYVLDHIFGLF